jgi:hypothetical protein
MSGESAVVVAGILAGEQGDIVAAVDSLRRAGLQVWVFDTTPVNRHRTLGGAAVHVRQIRWTDSFSAARNSGIEVLQAETEASAVLWVDTDERLMRGSLTELEAVARSLEGQLLAVAPIIEADGFQVTGVARMHSLRNGIRFTGHVHEYLADRDGQPVAYSSSKIVIAHETYAHWDRAGRNRLLLEKQIALDSCNPRWRPFLVRDAGSELSTGKIILANRQQALLRSQGDVGGIDLATYTRMIAWHTAWHLVSRGASGLVDDALKDYQILDDEARSELLYLRLIASVIAGQRFEPILLQCLAFRQASLGDREDFPWLDAGIAVALDHQGRAVDAAEYRAESSVYTDSFCEDSRLRPEFNQGTGAFGAVGR